jgi:GT2 family glycosyltransferase
VSQPASPQLDICIVSWRARDLLRACLRSVVGSPEAADVIVVDNASADGTVEMLRADFPTVRLIANEENRSFAAGNNQAIRAARSPFLLLLNPDTEVQPGALRALVDVFAEEPRVGAAAAQLILPDGSIQRSCRSFPEPGPILCDALGFARLFPRSRIFGRYRMRYWDYDTRREVDQPMASALALRRAALDEVGLFDEGFPLYFNDVDLCYRLRQAGWRVVFQPNARVRHHHGQSTRLVRPIALLDSHRGLIRFYRKHYRGRIGWLGYTAVTLGSWLTMYPRAALAWIPHRLRAR